MVDGMFPVIGFGDYGSFVETGSITGKHLTKCKRNAPASVQNTSIETVVQVKITYCDHSAVSIKLVALVL